MTFQDRLYRLRKERGISQEELSAVVGVSRQAVQKWESGASRPDMDNLTALARYFGVTLDYLVTGAEAAPAEGPMTVQTIYLAGWHYEYKSRAALFGLPLVHVNMGGWDIHWARGIIAVGNFATGVVAFGGLSAGLVSIGGLTAGGLALGAVGGAWALGGAATAGQIAAGGAASAPIAIGDAVQGAVTFPKEAWGPGTAAAIRAAIARLYPGTPGFLVDIFSSFR